MVSEPAENHAEAINAMHADGWASAMGLRLTHASRHAVAGELVVAAHHLQPYGIVHGGVHAGIIETLTSIGAALDAMPRGGSAVGLENHTSFLRAVRGGKLIATAKPLVRGRRSQVWEGEVRDDEGRLVATGRVRLLVLEADAAIAGERVEVKPTP